MLKNGGASEGLRILGGMSPEAVAAERGIEVADVEALWDRAGARLSVMPDPATFSRLLPKRRTCSTVRLGSQAPRPPPWMTCGLSSRPLHASSSAVSRSVYSRSAVAAAEWGRARATRPRVQAVGSDCPQDLVRRVTPARIPGGEQFSPVAASADIIRSRTAAGRPKDLAAVSKPD